MNLLWLQAGGCSGDSMSILNLKGGFFQLLEKSNIEVLFHPSLSVVQKDEFLELIEQIENQKQTLDILCIEGNASLAFEGMLDTFLKEPKYRLIKRLASQARYVVAVGTCAVFGGIGAGVLDEMEGVGIQYHHEKKGGLLGEDFCTKEGFEVINLPGCPIQPEALAYVLKCLSGGYPLELDEYNRPKVIYSLLVHQGCTRNEYHEYKVEERVFGEEGCMFFYLGCKGPITHGSCNKYLWNEVSSKTRAGVPCCGCTRPDFPQKEPFFTTELIADTPDKLPEGVDRAHYLAYKDLAALAAPKRLLYRKNGV